MPSKLNKKKNAIKGWQTLGERVEYVYTYDERMIQRRQELLKKYNPERHDIAMILLKREMGIS